MCHKGHISDEWRTKDSCGIVPPLNAANGQLWPDQLISQRAPNQCFWSCGLSQVTHKYEWGPSQSSGLWFIKAGKDRTFAQPSTVYFLFVRFMYTHFSVKKKAAFYTALWFYDAMISNHCATQCAVRHDQAHNSELPTFTWLVWKIILIYCKSFVYATVTGKTIKYPSTGWQ